MQNILVAGAGKSSIYLIHYLLSHASRNKWKIIVADGNEQAITEKISGYPFAEAAVIDIANETQRAPLVKNADIVVSLMPPHLHIHLAKDCLKYGKNLITSSYISEEMKEMDKAVKEAGLMFMCEMGLDPGIDHMTANQIIHSIQRVAGVITSFKSFCGGLVAPEDDNNPWHYKFSWNPKNIITAGVGGASFLQNSKRVDLPYEKIFEHNKRIKIEGIGSLAYYPNRDSLRYLELYDLPDIKTFLRATLRYPAFCKGWQAIIALGLTNSDHVINTENYTYAQWVKQAAGYANSISFAEYAALKTNGVADEKVMAMIEWLGILEEKQMPAKVWTSADILLDVLANKWKMAPGDKDMVAMQHEVSYLHKGRKINLCSTLMVKGENSEYSAMAKTVGLPMGILARMVLNKKIVPPTGVLIPNMASVYRPVLTELHHHGIDFKEEVA